MALRSWSNHFVSGFELADTRHRGLVSLINAPGLVNFSFNSLSSTSPLTLIGSGAT